MKELMIFSIIFVLAATGCEQSTELQETSSLEAADALEASVQLTTDKDLYHSNEDIKIDANIACNKEIENVSVRVYGIYASRNRIDETKVVSLMPGDNDIEFSFTTPSCNTCSGIKAGAYSIDAEISYNNKIIGNAKRNIEIKQ